MSSSQGIVWCHCNHGCGLEFSSSFRHLLKMRQEGSAVQCLSRCRACKIIFLSRVPSSTMRLRDVGRLGSLVLIGYHLGGYHLHEVRGAKSPRVPVSTRAPHYFLNFILFIRRHVVCQGCYFECRRYSVCGRPSFVNDCGFCYRIGFVLGERSRRFLILSGGFRVLLDFDAQGVV